MSSVNIINLNSRITNNVPKLKENEINFKSSDSANQQDSVEIAKRQNVEPPRISTVRLMFNLLTDQQIEQINKSRRLPDNAKFIMSGYGRFNIANNFFGIRVGTQTLPEGFEVKKDVLGFAIVLPKDSEGLMIR